MELFQELFGFLFLLSKKNIRVTKPKAPASNLISQPPSSMLDWEFYSLFWKKEKKRGKKIRKTSPKQYSVLVPADLFRILSLPFLDQERLVCTKNSTPPMVRWDPLPLFTEITHETASAFPRFLS